MILRNLLAAAAVAFCMMPAAAQDLETLTINGQSRTILVHAPDNLKPSRPLVISLHGAGQDAYYQKNQTNWNVCADSANFVVLYPNAIDNFWDVYGTGDIKFIDQLIDLMYDRYHVDLNRVYISGFSLGAMMTYHCIEHLGNRVAAFAPVSGVRFDNKAPIGPRRVPIIHTHGTGDNVFWYTGDLNHAAGGYPAIPEYVEKWATYENLDQKEEIQPYPASNPNSIATMTIWRSSNPDDDTEVRLLAIKDKGHWHSEDLASGVSTTQEIWRFCKRYSLGPITPVLSSVEPENESFDLPLEQRTFTFTFDSPVDNQLLTATLAGDGISIELENTTTENAATATFIVPAAAELAEGNYKLFLRNVRNPEGGLSESYTFTYTYGFTEVGDEVSSETIITPDWASMQGTVGEGIPYGWRRSNSRADGTADTRESGEANTGGARLKYFANGGDFNTGFYFSARDYDVCDFTYGLYNDYPMQLKPGKYELSFRSAYWNEGSQSGNATFNVAVAPASGDPVLSKSMASQGNLNEDVSKAVSGSAYHSFAFDVENSGAYTLNFSMKQGWAAVILADVTLTTYPSSADKYKGNFQRLMKRGRELYDLTADAEKLSIVNSRNRLKGYLDKYADLASTSPSVYTKAIEKLQREIDILESYLAESGVESVIADADAVDVEYFTTDGRRLNAPANGIILVRTRHANGTVTTEKRCIR